MTHDLYTLDAAAADLHYLVDHGYGGTERADMIVGDMLKMDDGGTDHLHLLGADQRPVSCDLPMDACPMVVVAGREWFRATDERETGPRETYDASCRYCGSTWTLDHEPDEYDECPECGGY